MVDQALARTRLRLELRARVRQGADQRVGGVDTDLLREREVWRVAAARGRVAAFASPEHDPGFGVFDLVFSWSEGSWQLVRAVD